MILKGVQIGAPNEMLRKRKHREKDTAAEEILIRFQNVNRHTEVVLTNLLIAPKLSLHRRNIRARAAAGMEKGSEEEERLKIPIKSNGISVQCTVVAYTIYSMML